MKMYYVLVKRETEIHPQYESDTRCDTIDGGAKRTYNPKRKSYLKVHSCK